MDRNNDRPVHLNLFVLRLPVTGVVSILHRLSGVLLVLALPFFLFLLQESLRDPEGLVRAQQWLRQPAIRLLLPLFVWAIALHFFAGVRHVLLDLDIGIGRTGARRGAWLVLGASVVTAVAAGWCL